MTTTSVFEPYHRKNYPHVYAGELHLHSIAGGVPLDPKVLEGHLARKVLASDDLIQAQVATIMVETGVTTEEAVNELAGMSAVGFAKDDTGCYVGGYQLKACLKEAACIAESEKRIPQKWGGASPGGKRTRSWWPEHVFVVNHRLPLGVAEPSEVKQQPVHAKGPKGPIDSIKLIEVVFDADIKFMIETDYAFKDDEWAAIWSTAERMGLGASRPMGYGRFAVTKWEKIGATDE